MSNTPKIELVQGEIASVSLKPGDRLVLMFKQPLSREYAARIQAEMEYWAPGLRCLALLDGARLGVIRQELMPDLAAGDPEG